MELPLPDGSFKRFRIEQASIAEPGLAVRCPDLKTYRGRGSDDRSAYVHFDWTPSGFHAVVDTAEGQVYIGPYSRGDTRNYVVYHARDWRPGPERTEGAPTARQAAPSPPAAVSASPGQPSPAAVSASPGQPSPASIEEIAIERRCFGCENQYKLTLGRDGTATLMIVGVLGVEHTCRGRVTPEGFARLAALMHREEFFRLNETYRSQAVDGQWATTSAIVAGWRKAVENSNQAGPPALKAIEDAIDALGETVPWTEATP